MNEIGEVREFATGCLISKETAPGVCQAVMQTEQRVWDGNQWCALGTPECAAVMMRVSQELIDSQLLQSHPGFSLAGGGAGETITLRQSDLPGRASPGNCA